MPDGDDDLARRPSTTARAVAFARQMLTVLALSFWFGGFTFYGSVVIPTALKVLGEHRAVGFITQPVTVWLNRIGVGALAVLLWNVVTERRAAGRTLRRALAATWLAMAGLQVVLFALHPVLDRMLDPAAGAILDRRRFVDWHRAYLLVSTAQWGITVLHLAFILISWRRTAAPAPARPARGSPHFV